MELWNNYLRGSYWNNSLHDGNLYVDHYRRAFPWVWRNNHWLRNNRFSSPIWIFFVSKQRPVRLEHRARRSRGRLQHRNKRDCGYDWVRITANGIEENFCGEADGVIRSDANNKEKEDGKWTPDQVNPRPDGFPDSKFIAGGSAFIRMHSDNTYNIRGFEFELVKLTRWEIIEFQDLWTMMLCGRPATVDWI